MSDPQRPREWALCGSESGDDFVLRAPDHLIQQLKPAECQKVIEKSAYDQVVKERDELKQERTNYRAIESILGDNGRVIELEDENDKLTAERDALAAQLDEAKTEDSKMVARLHRQSNIMAEKDERIERLSSALEYAKGCANMEARDYIEKLERGDSPTHCEHSGVELKK